jgi:alpha-beta hydrolase superfamily lysophospholipase
MARMKCASWLGTMLAAATVPASPQTAITPVSLRAADGLEISGLYRRAPQAKAVILLFHQAGSSKAEYSTIAPRLVAAGFSTLAIDQRSGGSLFGPNVTAARLGHEATYFEAKADLVAALDWARARHRSDLAANVESLIRAQS